MDWKKHTPDHEGIHIVIKGLLHDVELFPEIADLSGCAVAEHKEGRKQKERPHYHCWVPKDKHTIKEWKERLRTYYDSHIPNLNWNKNANAYYTVGPKIHDSFYNWVEYVARDSDVKIGSWVHWNFSSDPPQMQSLDDLVLPTPVNEITIEPSKPLKDQSKREAAHIRFYNWILSLDLQDELTVPQIVEYWVEWTHGAYELRNVSAPIRYVYYQLSLDKEAAKQRLVREIMRKNFENF